MKLLALSIRVKVHASDNIVYNLMHIQLNILWIFITLWKNCIKHYIKHNTEWFFTCVFLRNNVIWKTKMDNFHG